MSRPARPPAALAASSTAAREIDTEQLTQLFLSEEPVLLAAARAITLNDAEARDLVQATFELALRHAGQLREPLAVRSWLLTIQAREALRLRRRLARFVRLDPTVREVPAVEHGGDSLAIREALGGLPPRTRAAVVLRHMAGLSVVEVAQAMGTSPNTVKTQLRSGLARLREALADD